MTKHIARTGDTEKLAFPFAYIYRDPRKIRAGVAEPFYVGKGQGRRHRDHLYRKDKSHMTHRIQKMLALGITPVIEVIRALDQEHAKFLEVCLIACIGRADLGKGPLLNLTDGGDGQSVGFRHSAETRAKMSATRKGRPLPWLDGLRGKNQYTVT